MTGVQTCALPIFHHCIPINTNLRVPARWVRQKSDGRVELLAGRVQGEQKYIVELHADPNYSLEGPAEPCPIWFNQLLKALGPEFHTLREAVENLGNWNYEAEILRYREYADVRKDLMAQLDTIRAELTLAETRLDACRHRI